MSVAASENLTHLEKSLSESKYTIVVNNYLPDDVRLDLPPNPLLRKPAKYNDLDKDKTLTSQESYFKKIIIVLVITITFGLFIFAMRSEPEKKQKSYRNLDHKDVSQVKSISVNEMMVRETYVAKDKKSQSSLFGSQKIKVGDKVKTELENNFVDASGRARNFNTPLVIVADGGNSGSGGMSKADRLPIASNTVAHVYLEREIATGNLTAPVSAVTYVDLQSGGKTIVPKDSRLIGQCQRVNGSRVQIRFDGVIFPDGREFSIHAQALGVDNMVGVTGDINHNVGRKTGNMFASSLLNATSQSLSLTGNSFGTIFAGNMAGNTSDSLDNAIDNNMANSGATIRVATNTRFKVVFE